jgi:hypothetical protein
MHIAVSHADSHLNYDHIHNEQDHEQEGDNDEACLQTIPPLSPSSIVPVPIFRLLSSLESFVAVALELVHLLETVLPVVIDPSNLPSNTTYHLVLIFKPKTSQEI